MKTCIIGSGSWSLALTKIFNENNILIKCREIQRTIDKFQNAQIKYTTKFSDLSESKYIFLAIPSQTVRNNLKLLKKYYHENGSIFVICSKGVEKKTNKLMSEVVNDFFPNNKVAILSGPNFSDELISNKPSASVLSSKNKSVLYEVSSLLSQKKFRIYFNNDIIGTQLGGAMKNVIAIACGLIKGKNIGENARAAIITRGMSEIVQLGVKMGAKRNTFYGLSGIGDLTLTCSSMRSRNTRFGYEIAKGENLSKLRKKCVLEGIESCESICNLGKKYTVELPLCNAVKKIINGVEVNKIISSLLSRPLQFEK